MFAGKIPKTIPIKAEKRRLPIATLNEIDGFISAILLLRMLVKPAAKPKPISHQGESIPLIQLKNCVKIFLRVAPKALRKPISRVRSVTDTSMMFITPIPPTNNEIPAIAPITVVIMP